MMFSSAALRTMRGSSDASVADSEAAPADTTATADTGDGCTVGVSWFTFQEERYGLRDEPGNKAALEAGGATYVSNDGKNSAEIQAANVENLIAQGVDVLVIDAFDSEAIKPSVAAAQAAGIPVLAYDRLIEDPSVLYLTHDNVEVGRMIARQITSEVPKGVYALIKGDQANPNSLFLEVGFHEIIDPLIDDGSITIGGDQFTDSWAPDTAQTNMEQILTANDNKIDAVLSQNDGMAGGVIAALALQGLDGTVRVGGQDGDLAALNRVALGTQSVSVWKDRDRTRHRCRRSCAAALRRSGSGERRGHQPVRDTGRQHRVGDPAEADPDHPGQPGCGRRRRLDRHRDAVPERPSRIRRRLPISGARSNRPQEMGLGAR